MNDQNNNNKKDGIHHVRARGRLKRSDSDSDSSIESSNNQYDNDGNDDNHFVTHSYDDDVGNDSTTDADDEDNGHPNNQTRRSRSTTTTAMHHDNHKRKRNNMKQVNDDDSITKRRKYHRERKVRIPYITNRYIRWNDMVTSANTSNNNNPLFSSSYHIPYPEMDELIGWATDASSIHHDHDNNHLTSNNHISNPLEYLSNSTTTNIPLRNSFLRYIHDTSIDIIKGSNHQRRRRHHQEYSLLSRGIENDNDSLLFQQFDMSALVAIGMIIEEMMTITLLPYAQRHSDRCRHLVDETTSTKTQHTTSSDNHDSHNMVNELRRNPYYQWTLPPEEALFNLFYDYYDHHNNDKPGEQDYHHTSGIYGISGLVTSYPPTRTSTGNIAVVASNAQSHNNKSKEKKRKPNDVTDRNVDVPYQTQLRDSVNKWCQTRKYPDVLLQPMLSPSLLAKEEANANDYHDRKYDYDQELMNYLFLPLLPSINHKKKTTNP